MALSACSVSDALLGFASRPNPTGADSIDVMILRRPTGAGGALGSAWLAQRGAVDKQRVASAEDMSACQADGHCQSVLMGVENAQARMDILLMDRWAGGHRDPGKGSMRR